MRIHVWWGLRVGRCGDLNRGDWGFVVFSRCVERPDPCLKPPTLTTASLPPRHSLFSRRRPLPLTTSFSACACTLRFIYAANAACFLPVLPALPARPHCCLPVRRLHCLHCLCITYIACAACGLALFLNSVNLHLYIYKLAIILVE